MPDLSLWTYWWEYNRAAYLDLKSAVFSGGPVTGAADDPFGRESKAGTLRPTENQVRSKVVPALLKALAEETHNDIVTGSLIALAKIGGDPAFLDAFAKHFPSRTVEIAETAALAVGILGLPAGRSTLEHLAADDEEGRKLVDGKEVPYRTRAFSVYGLGLIGQASPDDNVRAACSVAIRNLLESDRSSYKDIKVACILSLGLIPDEGALSVETLRRILQNKTVDKQIRAHCPRSLALLVGRTHRLRDSVIGNLADLLADKKEKDFVRQSAVYALGQLLRPGDEAYEAVVKTVETLAQESRDEQERSFALLALGKMGGPEAQDFLIKQLQKSGNGAMRSWAAIGLGALGHNSWKASGSTEADIVRVLQMRFSDEKSPSNLGAYAIALGMCRDVSSKDLLVETLKRSKDEEVQGYVSLALGMIGVRDSADLIRGYVKEAKNKPQLLYQGTIALGLLGQKNMLLELLDMLGGAKTLATRAAVVSSLAYIGDQRAIDPLIENLGNKKLQPIERGFSASALGLVCDKQMLPWNAAISVDMNYRAAVTTLSDKAGAAGIVDIL